MCFRYLEDTTHRSFFQILFIFVVLREREQAHALEQGWQG